MLIIYDSKQMREELWGKYYKLFLISNAVVDLIESLSLPYICTKKNNKYKLLH